MLFVKHIFDFSQTAAQILMKFGSYMCMHLSKVTQVCSNQGYMTYFHRNYVNEILVSYVISTCMSYFVHFFQFLDILL